MDSADITTWVSHDIEQMAKKRANERIAVDRWNRDVTVFAFSILIIVIILIYNEVMMEIVATIAILGLVLIWIMGWLQGKKLFEQTYDEELLKLQQEVKNLIRETDDDAIEEKVRKAMRDMWR